MPLGSSITVKVPSAFTAFSSLCGFIYAQSICMRTSSSAMLLLGAPDLCTCTCKCSVTFVSAPMLIIAQCDRLESRNLYLWPAVHPVITFSSDVVCVINGGKKRSLGGPVGPSGAKATKMLLKEHTLLS